MVNPVFDLAYFSAVIVPILPSGLAFVAGPAVALVYIGIAVLEVKKLLP